MNSPYILTKDVKHKGDYDVIVAGGGLAGIAAAVSATRAGKKTLLVEKTICLGGLATIGLVNFFVPMCNGRGVQIIKGMAEEFFQLSIKYGFDTFPECWKEGTQKEDSPRYVTKFSAPIFALALDEYVKNEGVTVLYDSILSYAAMDKGHCEGVIVENKSGSEYYTAKMFVDATGDADLMRFAGMPTVQGENYHTMYAYGCDTQSCQKVIDTSDIAKVYKTFYGGNADLHGNGQPEDKPLWKGADAYELTDYVVENHLELLNKIKNEDKTKRDIFCLPTMPQLRTTCHLDGDATFTEDAAYKHYDDSIAAICDFDRRDFVYEVSYKVLVKTGFDNIITAGRTASAEGFGWDLIRVIPPAIITGQAAGNACSQAIDERMPIYGISISELQKKLENQNVMIHFDDSLIPDGKGEGTGEKVDVGHN